MASAIDYGCNPSILSLDELRSSLNGSCIREQHLNVLNAVITVSMLHCARQEIANVCKQGLLQSAILLHIAHCGSSQRLHIGMGKSHVCILLRITLENVVLHYFSSFVGMFNGVALCFRLIIVFFLIGTLGRLVYQESKNLLLLFIHGINYVLDRSISGFIISHVVPFFLWLLVGVGKSQILLFLREVNMCFKLIIFAVGNSVAYICDVSSRISTSKNQTEFFDFAMEHITLGTLFEVVCVDGQTCNIAIHDHLFGVLTRRGIIECSVSKYAFVSIHQKSMTENIRSVIVLMIPNKRNCSTVIGDKSIFPDCPAIGTLNIVSSSPATKIVFLTHFEFLLYPSIV